MLKEDGFLNYFNLIGLVRGIGFEEKKRERDGLLLPRFLKYPTCINSEQSSSAGDESAFNSDNDMLSIHSPRESIVEAMMDSG